MSARRVRPGLPALLELLAHKASPGTLAPPGRLERQATLARRATRVCLALPELALLVPRETQGLPGRLGLLEQSETRESSETQVHSVLRATPARLA